jgi:hypothetical protein
MWMFKKMAIFGTQISLKKIKTLVHNEGFSRQKQLSFPSKGDARACNVCEG